MEPAATGGPYSQRKQEFVQLIITVLKERVLPKLGRGWRRYRVSDFLHPHTPTLTYPASHTAPFSSPPPTDDKVCH